MLPPSWVEIDFFSWKTGWLVEGVGAVDVLAATAAVLPVGLLFCAEVCPELGFY